MRKELENLKLRSFPSNSKMILLIGTILSYICLLIIPSVRFIPLPFAVFFLFACKYFRNYKNALFLTAVLAIPFSMGKSMLKVDDSFYLIINPFTAIVICLSLVSLKEKMKQLSAWPLFFLMLFLMWGFLSTFFWTLYPETLDGIFRLSITVIFYLLSRIYMPDQVLKRSVIFILLSLLFFESGLTAVQFMLGHPLGRFVEEGISLFPYGRLTSENITLYRPSGSMTEPTWIARFLTMLLPVILIELKSIVSIKYKYRVGLIALSLFAIFATFTRVSWAVALILLVITYFWRKPEIDLSILKKPMAIIFIFIFLIFSTLRFYPLLENRIVTSSRSFEELGSFDSRIKLVQEAVSLISTYPVFGVGLNRFVSSALDNDITGYFKSLNVGVHNVPLYIASEMGILAMVFFLLFIGTSYCQFWKEKDNIRGLGKRNFAIVAGLGGLAYILESQMGTIFLSPHLSLFMLYMAIIAE